MTTRKIKNRVTNLYKNDDEKPQIPDRPFLFPIFVRGLARLLRRYRVCFSLFDISELYQLKQRFDCTLVNLSFRHFIIKYRIG